MDDGCSSLEQVPVEQFIWARGPGENAGDWYTRTQQRRDEIEKSIGAFLAQSPALLEEYQTIKTKCARDSIDMAFCQRRLRKIFADSDPLTRAFAPFLDVPVATESEKTRAKSHLSAILGITPRKENPNYPSFGAYTQFGYDVEERLADTPAAEAYLRWKLHTFRLHKKLDSLPLDERKRAIDEAAQQQIDLLEGHPDLLSRFDALRHGYLGPDRSALA